MMESKYYIDEDLCANCGHDKSHEIDGKIICDQCETEYPN